MRWLKMKELRLIALMWLVLAASGLGKSAWAQAPGGSRILAREVFKSTNLLSPNEADDWPLQAKTGEVVIVEVTSSAFDPVAEIISPSGAVVAQNDDRRKGDQESLLLARLPSAGAYKIRVRASRPPAEGRYQFSVRRFVPLDSPLGQRAPGTLAATGARWHRFEAQAGQRLVISTRASGFAPMVEIFSPLGEAVGSAQPVEGREGLAQARLVAGESGAFYARVSGSLAGASYAFSVAVARVRALTVGAAPIRSTLDAGGLDLWTFNGTPGQLIRVQVQAPGEMDLLLSSSKPEVEVAEEEEGAAPPISILAAPVKSGGETFALINEAGPFQIEISQPAGRAAQYTLLVSPALAPLRAGDTSGTIVLGGSQFWAFEGKAGQIVRFEAGAQQFDAALELFSPRGASLISNDDGGTNRAAAFTALLLEEGKYLLRVHAFGGGGAGAYRLRQIANPVRALPIEGTGGSLGVGGTQVHSFSARAGATVILSARSNEFDIKMWLFAPDGTEVAVDEDSGEATDSLLSARLPIDGVYTVWLGSQSGGGRYSLQMIPAR